MASVDKVEAGTTLADNAGRGMDDIVSQVKRVTDLIAEISAASGEQTQGISQVSDAVAQLDQVTQQNAALVEESAAAADSLREQAARLVQVVQVFRIHASDAHAVASSSYTANSSRAASASPVRRVAAARSPTPRKAIATHMQKSPRPSGARPPIALADRSTASVPRAQAATTSEGDWESF